MLFKWLGKIINKLKTGRKEDAQNALFEIAKTMWRGRSVEFVTEEEVIKCILAHKEEIEFILNLLPQSGKEQEKALDEAFTDLNNAYNEKIRPIAIYKGELSDAPLKWTKAYTIDELFTIPTHEEKWITRQINKLDAEIYGKDLVLKELDAEFDEKQAAILDSQAKENESKVLENARKTARERILKEKSDLEIERKGYEDDLAKVKANKADYVLSRDSRNFIEGDKLITRQTTKVPVEFAEFHNELRENVSKAFRETLAAQFNPDWTVTGVQKFLAYIANEKEYISLLNNPQFEWIEKISILSEKRIRIVVKRHYI